MTNEQINNLEKRPYTFGNKKGIEVSYDEETNAVVIPEALFRYILSQIPSIPTECLDHSEQWISLKDKLPPDGSWNIFTDGKHISVERYKYDAIDHFFPSGRWFELDEAICWMPMPKMPTNVTK